MAFKKTALASILCTFLLCTNTYAKEFDSIVFPKLTESVNLNVSTGQGIYDNLQNHSVRFYERTKGSSYTKSERLTIAISDLGLVDFGTKTLMPGTPSNGMNYLAGVVEFNLTDKDVVESLNLVTHTDKKQVLELQYCYYLYTLTKNYGDPIECYYVREDGIGKNLETVFENFIFKGDDNTYIKVTYAKDQSVDKTTHKAGSTNSMLSVSCDDDLENLKTLEHYQDSKTSVITDKRDMLMTLYHGRVNLVEKMKLENEKDYNMFLSGIAHF